MSSRVGTVLGNYRLTSLIGSGSMGDVFRGQHVQKDRTAAVKVLRGEAIATLRHHLRRDMKRVLELDHPNIVRLYELGEEDGAFFLVYEYVPDGSLRTMLQRRRESRQGGTLTQDLRLVYQASQALAYAHKRGFVHCDVKPDNLLLSRSGNVYTVKVADFGLMQLVQADAVTATDVILGTPAYMSPEQCQGLQAEPRSDIYSLGVVLYEIATGYLPFDANTPSEAIHKHVSAKPIPPREVRRDLPVRLEEIILRCLAKRPGERYPSAEALGQALVDFDRSILPAPPVVRKAPVREEETLAFPAASVPQHPQIRVLDERGHELQKITLHKSIDIGRGEENNVVLPEKVVSSRHARVDWDGTRLTVVDLGSKNHTRLGETILVPNAPREWAQGQVLKIGPYRLEVEYPHVVQKPSTIRYEEDQTVLAGGRELGAETYVSSAEATGFGEQPAEAPLPKVRVLDKAGKELQVIELRDELTIGRKEDSGIVLADRVVSLQHARLNWDGSRVTVTDLRSSNGTRLDSTTVAPDSPEVWAQGQVLKIGPYRLEVEYPEVVPKPSAARYVEDQTMPVGGRELGAETYVSSVEATGFGEQPAEAPLPKVRVLDKAGKELQVIELRDELTIGRKEDSGIVLADRVVSLQHARLNWDGSRVTVTDLRSSNGTRLDSTTVAPDSPEVWTQGQVLKIGPYRLEVEYPEVVPKPSAARYVEDQTMPVGGRELGAETYVSSVEATGFGEQPAEAPLPKVRVLDKAGKELQVIELRDELTIGRKEDSGIVLADRVVSLQHARLNWDGSRVTVTDLRSSNGTRLGGTRLVPNTAQVWQPGDLLEIGSYRFELEQITPVVSETSMVRQLVEVDRIGVTLEENELELEPGTPTVLSVTLANHGETVDHFSLRVDGIDERWVIGPPRPPQLFPGSETVVPLTVLVPRDPASEARTYHVNVRALSKDRDWEYGQASAQWRVLPYEATEFTIAPARVRSRGDARFRIVLRNNGNVPVDYKVFADDDEQVLRYDFSNATLSAGPGETATTGLIASRARRWFGAPQPFSLNVSAVPLTKGPPQAASAQFVHQAIIPSWLPPVAILVLLFLAFSLYRWITQPPTIQNLVVEPTNPVSGQAVTVRWEVAHATEVVFLPLGDVVDASLGYHTFQEGFLDPLTLTLVARNRFNKTTEKALAIAVTPPPAELPVVEEWSVSEKEVVQGQTVTLRWRVSGAQSVYIQPFGTEALEGIREDTPQQNKTYTLIATNRDQRIERSIEVVVTPPKMAPPQIVSFTVDPSSMAGGERTKVRLQWDTRGATSVSIEPGLGAVGPKGAREIDAPEFTTTYELLATNEGGEKIARAEVEIRDALAGVFAVRGLSASVTPSESSTCPATFTFFGTITANGAGTVTYVWERSDGAQPEEQTVAFDGPGSKVVRATWTVGAPANTVSGWQQLKVVTPNAMTSQPASFSVNCPGTGTGTGPVETCISFNQDGLRVVRTDAFAGNAPVWAVSDGVVLVRQFASEADAQLAAATMERFGMNTYCTVGRPEPTMEYYLVSGRSPAGEANGEQCTTFNPERLRVRRERRWIVLRGNEWFIAGDRGFEHEFHNEAEARQALAVIQQYGFTNRCSVGSEESGFVYFRR